MLKHASNPDNVQPLLQPPSGGCVLKQDAFYSNGIYQAQPPSGGCVLKQRAHQRRESTVGQPPSGGCVLKLKHCQTQ